MKIVDIRKTIKRNPNVPTSYRNIESIKYVVIHHSLTTSGDAEAFANYHVDKKGWSRMGYHYVIKTDGTIQWAADWNVKTPHVGRHNTKSLGICLVGDFRLHEPTAEQYSSLYSLIDYIRNELKIKTDEIVGHQELSGYEWKQCPALDMDSLRGNIEYNVNKPVKNNFNNDKKIDILEIERKSDLLDFKNKWQWDMLADILKEFHDKNVLDSDEWYKKAKNKSLTQSELAFLNTILIKRNIFGR